MSLPKLVIQKYDITLPLSGKEIQVQPYLTKHERLLLKARESEDNKEIMNVTYQILEDCTFGEKVDDLPMADVEYLLIKLKSFSSGELLEMAFRCQNEIEVDGQEQKCNHRVELDIDLDKELIFNREGLKDSKIKLTEDIGLVMKPPSFKIFQKLLDVESEADQLFIIMAACVDYVWQEDEIYRDWNKKEIEEFLESLNAKQMQDIKEYIESIPSVRIVKDFKCTSCEYEEKLVLKDVFDFFT